MAEYIDEAKKLIAGEEAGVRYRDPLEATGFAQINHALTYWPKLSSDAYRLYAAYRSLVDIGDHVISNDAIAKLLGWGVTKLKDNKAELISLGLITCEKTAFSGASVIYIEPLRHVEEVNQIAEQFTEARNERIETRLRYRANKPQLRPIEVPNEPQSRPIEASNKPQLRPHIRKEDSEEEGKKEKKLSPAPSSGRRGRSVPKTGYRDEDIEHVAVGDENGNEKQDAAPTHPLEHLICQGTHSRYLSVAQKRKLREPVHVVPPREHKVVAMGSPIKEYDDDPEGFADYVRRLSTKVGGGRPSRTDLINAVRNYDRPGTGWMHVRAPDNDLPVDDPSQPWNQ